ncbi:MAG: Hsp20/alpha crystallin family protein [Xanthobacteraceae bacterium]|nr:Hsp20/alpha crystallin family protein [Xanthobacteraceae bacterium]MBV9234869.1 Hsp20/alpha crystallin family protein [Xanthobacteraceae bacterium]MBV9630729.1 Hsp20/alpha crystallin family protein [Xanthobacteraceae bacterium]
MWSEACDSLARAERLHRQFFQPRRPGTWEPPVDILETEREVLLFFALPGVSIDKVEAIIDGADLVVAGTRVLPPQLRTAVIHRIELPQGRFERRVRLPAGRYRDVVRAAADGCLVITLRKAEAANG